VTIHPKVTVDSSATWRLTAYTANSTPNASRPAANSQWLCRSAHSLANTVPRKSRAASITMAANTSKGDPLNARMVVLLARCRGLGMAVDCLCGSRSA
jgi:hypothetical protein